MRILMISPYPPHRDGIARYAVQSVARLRAQGHDVVVLSPYPSAAHRTVDLPGVQGARALVREVRGFDRVIVQFHPDVFFAPPYNPAQRTATSLALTRAWRAARNLEVRVHEVNYRWGRGGGAAALAIRAMWRAVPRIVVHTEAERRDFVAAFGVSSARVHVAAHGEDFLRHTSMTRQEARDSLGIPRDDTMFLSIGFIQEHKGFDRAVRALRRIGGGGDTHLRLDVVGSMRLEDPAQAAYAESLRRLVRRTPGAHLHQGFLTDEMFDRWIVATDVVVLPYRHIWSSGVLERAALYERPVIATRVGGLSDQASQGGVLVDDDAELERAMRRMAQEHGARVGSAAPQRPWPAPGAPREAVEQEVRARAAALRVGQQLEPGRAARTPAARATAPIRRMAPVGLPAPQSSRPFVVPLKRAVQRLTAWELQPLVEQVNLLQQRLVDALEALESDGDDVTP